MMNEWIISSSLLILAVLLGRKLLKGKISLRLQYALWAVVLIRLLVPIQLFTSDFGVGSVARQVDVAQPVRQAYTAARTEAFEVQYSEAYTDVAREYASQGRTATAGELQRETLTRVEETREADLRIILLGVWLAGMAALTAVLIGSNVHFARCLRRSRRELADIHAPLLVCETAAVSTPCLFGLFPPVIYLTPETAGEEQIRAHILAHEQTHYRHGDHIWAVLRNICLVLHWYNPLVWIAAKVSKADAELACDEGTLSRLGEEALADYGRTLIGLSCAGGFGASMIAATTMTGSKRTLTDRIKLLMKRPRNTVLTLIALVLLGTIIIGFTFAGAPETTKPLDLIVFPGTEWFMTTDEVLAALEISREDCREWENTGGEGMTAIRFLVDHQDAFGVPMELNFTFHSYWPYVEPVLTEVYAYFEDHADFETVRSLYAERLGETDIKKTPGIEEMWSSGATLRELLDGEGYGFLRGRISTDADALDAPASYVTWLDNGISVMIWRTELPVPADPGGLGILRGDGLLVYPGTTWNMTPAAVQESLGLSNDASGGFTMSSGKDGGYTRKEYAGQKVFGYSAKVEFYYEYYDRQGLPGLKQVLVVLDPKADMDALYESFTLELGEAVEVEEGTVYRWDSADRLSVYSGNVADTEPASQIYFINGNTRPLTGIYALTGKAVLFVSELPRAIQQGGDPEYGTLTQAQIDRVNEAFAATLSANGSQRINPLAGYFASYYSDATQIELAAYLRHSVDHHHDGDILEAAEAAGLGLSVEEAQARGIRRVHAHNVAEQVRTETGSDFENWTDYRQSGDGVTYLAGFDNYYVEPLDTVPAAFVCIGGHYDDGWAELYSETSVLTLAKIGGSYKFVSHLPREEMSLSVDGEIRFPGVEWNTSVEEVKAALDLGEGDYTVYLDEDVSGEQHISAGVYKEYGISVTGLELFGPTQEVRFEFCGYTRSADPALTSILVIYPDGTDMTAIYDQVAARLGQPEENETGWEGCWTWEGEKRSREYMSQEYFDDLYTSALEDFRDPESRLDVLMNEAASWVTLLDGPGDWGPAFYTDPDAKALYFLSAKPSTTQEEQEYWNPPPVVPREYTDEQIKNEFLRSRYQAALTSLYADPSQVHLGQFFYDTRKTGAGEDPAENALLREHFFTEEKQRMPVFRVTVQRMDRDLSNVFGITTADTGLDTMEPFLYCEETDAYICAHEDSNLFEPDIQRIVRLENGDIAMYYCRPEGDTLYVVTLRPTQNSLLVLSNLEAE